MTVAASHRSGLARAACVGGLGAILLGIAGQVAAFPLKPSGPPVATGLDNPKGLTFGPDGTLYIAEAGHGGSGPCITGADGHPVCYGTTAAITQVVKGVQRRIVSGLPSLAGANGFAATGPHDVSAVGGGALLVPIGLGSDPANTAQGGVLHGTGLGTVIRVEGRSGQWKTLADVAAYEGAQNPDGGQPDTNPFGLLALPDRNLVADAGGNDVLQVTSSGVVSTVAVFPNQLVQFPPGSGQQIPMQAVPTAIAQGPNRHLYISRLTGFPFPVGGSRIVEMDGAGIVHAITGFTNVVDLTFGRDGNLYVVEISTSGLATGQMDGDIWRVAPGANDKSEGVKVAEVQAPGGAAFGPDGNLYVTAGTVVPSSAGGGVVLKFDVH